MIKRIYYFLFWSFVLFAFFDARATETLEVKADHRIEVRPDSGKAIELGPGAQLSLSRTNDSGWAWSVQVIRRSGDSPIQTKPTWAKIGKQTLHDYLEEGVLGEVSAQKTGPKTFEVRGEGAIEVLDGNRRLYLSQGDRVERVDDLDESWKAALIIQSSENPSLVGKTVHIGSSYLAQLIESSHIISDDLAPQPRSLKPQKTSPSRVRPRARPAEVELNAQLDCPEYGSYRVEQSFFFDAVEEDIQSEAMSISSGSTIKVIKGEDSKRCHFVLTRALEAPLSEYIGRELLTYPSNLTEQSLSVYLSKQEEKEAQSQGLSFRKGTSFILSSPGSLNAFNIGMGRTQKVSASFVLDVEHAGPHLIELRGQSGDHFIVERSELEELRSQGEVVFDGPWSLGKTLDEVEDVEVGEVSDNCAEGASSHADWEDQDPIVWESCRTDEQVGSNGRKLLANDYYDNLIEELGDFGEHKKQQVLRDPEKRELTKCIKQSLKGGLNRNIRPVCEYDSDGKLKQRPIRKNVTKTNSRGVRYRTQEITHPAPRACASETTSSFLADRFERAGRCLGLAPREIFDLINHESHFQPGAISATGALSVGQTVISNYLQIHENLKRAQNLISKGGQRLEGIRRFSDPEVYRQDYENSNQRTQTRYTVFLVSELEDKIKNPKDHGCEDLKHLMDNPIQVPSGVDPAQHVLNTENRRLCLPQQPGQSFLMAGLDYLANKKYAQALIGNWEDDKSAQSDEHLKDIAQILGKWMYNGGQEGMARSFEYFMQELQAGRVTKRDDKLNPVVQNSKTQTIKARSLSELSLEDFKKYMSVHVKQRYPGGSARKTEVAGYIQKMDRDAKRLKDRGLECTL